MDKFIVSARKYRPQNFNTVVGQSHITTTLKNAINNNKLAHAFLFCGPRGVGKTTCARILAKTINCENKTPDGEACNTCNSCVSFDHGNSFNINELDAASNNGVDAIKDLIEQVRFQPQAGRYKVYIVDEVHMLTSHAFNAFLKTLEEPPAHAIFILATTEKHKILPTILSRCQIFDFKRITTNDTVTQLESITEKENIQAEKAALHVIAQKSEGCLRDALSILDKIVSFTGGNLTYQNTLEHLNILDEDYFFRFIEHLTQQQLPDALLLHDEINQKGFEGDTLLDGFAEFIRNILVCKDERALKLLDVAIDFKPKYLQIANKVETGWLIATLNLISECAISYKVVRNKKLHIELLLIKLSYLSQAIQLSINENGLEKKKITEQNKVLSFKSLPIIEAVEVVSKKIVASQPTKSSSEAKLIIQEPKPIIATPKTIVEKNQPEKVSNKLGSLASIKNRVILEQQKLNSSKPITPELLQEAWGFFIDRLSADNNHSSATNFKFAELRVIDANNFDIVAESVIQQKFIESERAALITHMQQFFENRFLKYNVLLEEKETFTEQPEVQKNTKERFALLASKFPLLKDLKEKLNLDLEI
jgi:DNA polymerase-3 subunit gamma/tau